jgi:hypothetical protein
MATLSQGKTKLEGSFMAAQIFLQRDADIPRIGSEKKTQIVEGYKQKDG